MATMQGETKARWLESGEQAAVEQDPAKLLERVERINETTAEKRRCLEQGTPLAVSGPSSFLP
jgi:hypothetical protein